jgi:putative ABC transport system permease protein
MNLLVTQGARRQSEMAMRQILGATRLNLVFQLLGSFALLGIVVAGLGVYATTSLMAASWNREMGIRMAMGAQTWDILRLALWRGTRAVLFGLPVGLFLAWILSRILYRYLFQLKTDDPFVWIISCAALLVITTVAAFIPALRVSRVNPLDALRSE